VAGECAAGHRDLESLPAAYAAWRGSELGRITDALEQDLILAHIGPPAALRALDVGCGDGLLALELAAQGADVTGVDTSRQMITAACKRAERRGRDIGLGIAEAGALPFASGTFDVVVAVTVLCFIKDSDAALSEMTRVLKPGGRLVIGELGKWSTWAAVRRIKGWLGSPVWGRARFRTAPELRRFAAAAGLTDISVKGAVFYPPIGVAARLLAPLDRKLTEHATVGAAFLCLAATKPDDPPCPPRQ